VGDRKCLEDQDQARHPFRLNEVLLTRDLASGTSLSICRRVPVHGTIARLSDGRGIVPGI
jgi:hypothetical protein